MWNNWKHRLVFAVAKLLNVPIKMRDPIKLGCSQV